ncbi:hypothetical protein ACFQDD_06995 [Halorubrum pallidum]|uniref:Uncharacterized protein n=1 Tax=Halorubrum pallidum TaxID=1526114 RepID=A0ABD5T1Z8_9EURY
MPEDSPTEDQTIDVDEATDEETIRSRLPAAVVDELTKQAFSPGAVRRLLRDCYYLGPISIGTGGWHGAYGNGQPGTGLRRPSGALYDFPRSWRYAAIVRGLRTGLITHVGNSRFATTELGAAVLDQIDRCPEHGTRREPAVKETTYIGNPYEEGKLQSHALITRCPECGSTGYDHGSVVVGYERFEQDEEWVEYALETIEGKGARVFADSQPVDGSDGYPEVDVDEEKAEEIATEVVEEQEEPTPREWATPADEGLYGREVVTVPGEGRYGRFVGTDEAIAVSRTDEQGDIHISHDGGDRLKIGMSYELAVERELKELLHHESDDAEWTGDYWTVGANRINRVLSKFTVGILPADAPGHFAAFPDAGSPVPEEAEYLTVTIEQDALDAVTVPVIGVDDET